MKIAEAAMSSGLSISTIRYYERIGLCPRIERAPDGQRRFSGAMVQWLILLASLRDTGMPMQRMRHFAELYKAGDATIAERKAVLQAHSDQLQERRATLDRCDALLATKIARYDVILGDAA